MNQSQLTELVEQATSAENQRPPIEVINKIVDQVNSKDTNAQVVSDQLLRRLQMTQLRVIFFALGLLDILMDKCKTPFHKQVSNQAFMKQLVAMLNNPKMNQEIQNRIAFLIKKWGEKFESKQEILPNFTQVYQALLKRGVKFSHVPTQGNAQAGQGGSTKHPVAAAKAPTNSKTDSKGGEIKNLPAKYQKLINDMNLVKGNVNFTNEIIDSAIPGERNETLNDLFRTLTQLEPKLINMIAQIDDERVMSMCLIVNDDLHKTFERYRALKKGRKPEKFVPGESTSDTMLTPSHIYSSQPDAAEKADNKSSATSPPAQQQPAPDLFDLIGNSSSQPAAPQQQQMPMQQPPMAGQDPMMAQYAQNNPMADQMQAAMAQRVQMQMAMNQQQMAQNPQKMGQPPNPMMQQMQAAMAQQYQQQLMQQQQMQQQKQQPPKKQVDPNDVVGRLNEVLAEMNSNPQPAASQPNQYATSQQIQQANNPFAGMSGYQNPNHNRPMYNTQVEANPFGQGPSAESWQKDVNELGYNMQLTTKNKNENDNVKEFQDLFSFGTNKIKQVAAPKAGIDLTYNPGIQPPQQQQQQQPPAMAQAPTNSQKPPELSLFDDNTQQTSMQQSMGQQVPVLENDPFAPAPVGDITEKFGQMNFNKPSEEEDKSQANIDNILGSFQQSSGEVQAEPVDASKLFNFAGMDTVRSEDKKEFDFNTGAISDQTNEAAVQPNFAESQATGNNGASNDRLADFMM